MRIFDKAEKLNLMNHLLTHDVWQLIVQEYDRGMKNREAIHNLSLEKGETNATFYNAGFMKGIEWCLNRPYQIKTENENFFKRLQDKVFGGVR